MLTMKAFATDSYGPIEGLRVHELPLPEQGSGQLRVRVHSAAVNPSDFKVATGATKILHGRRFPMALGWDFSGAVDALGAGTTGYSVGDPVFGFLEYSGKNNQGTFAEAVVVGTHQLARRPDGVSPATAAACATPAITALQAMRDDGRLKAGGRVLIIGASGGVGVMAVGLAQRLGGTVTGVCSTHAVELVKQLGAARVIDRKKEDPLGGGPYDLIFDAAAAHTFAQCSGALTTAGAYVTTLPSAGWAMGKLLTAFSSKSCALVMVQPKAADLAFLAGELGKGLQVPIDSTFPVRDVVAAIQRQTKGEMRGRIVVQVEGGF